MEEQQLQSVLKILFIDDHAGLRDGLCFCLSQKNPQLSFVTALSSKDGISALKENEDCSIAVVDINLDGENGLELIPELRKIVPLLKVIVFSMYSDPIHIEQALKANIQGYITKDSPLDELEEAIVSVNKGNSYFNRQTNKVIVSLATGTKNGFQSTEDKIQTLFYNYKALSKKEQEVFLLLAKKKETWEIAEILGKSEKTVINQKSIIYQKLNIRDRLDLLDSAKTLGVIF